MDQDDKADIVKRLFAVITALAEDIEGAAGSAQGHGPRGADREVASQLAEKAQQIAAIADAAAALSDLS